MPVTSAQLPRRRGRFGSKPEEAAAAADCACRLAGAAAEQSRRRRRRPTELCRAAGLVVLLGEPVTGVAAALVIVLDLDGDGLYLTDSSYPICLDVDGDGSTERLTWTAPRREDAFLWRDADGDGVLDHGGELIASFDDLAALDAPAAGGDGDRRLSVADRGWRDLALWVDRDHDGAVGPGESGPLDDRVAGIDLAARPAGELDGSLNLYRRTATFQPADPSDPPRPCREVAFRVLGSCKGGAPPGP